eukprot:TRINITY_DN20224_c0_g1_i2.p2 TRINITY_DN20224_c0_g1~~TRINITY_DN20224_c0_g1_i2.p2  ORF type:complete len:246 (-),score=17.89 TRINITY_DN20224_c0_g1_i2:293-1030(-)
MLTPPLLALLGVESVFALLLIIPVRPIRRIPIFLLSSFKSAALRIVAATVGVLLLVLLAVGLVHLWQLQSRLNDPTVAFASAAGNIPFHEAKLEMLTAVVQTLLLAFSLMLGLLLPQLAESLRQNELGELSLATLKKQAKGLQDEYMRLANERTGEKDLEEEAVMRIRKLKETIGRMEKEAADTQSEIDKWQGRTRAAETNVAAIRKQTEGLQLEYDRLLDENESLRAQLAVFDRKFASANKKLI